MGCALIKKNITKEFIKSPQSPEAFRRKLHLRFKIMRITRNKGSDLKTILEVRSNLELSGISEE